MRGKIVDEDTRLLAIFRYTLTDDDVGNIADDAYNVSTATVNDWTRNEGLIRKMCEKGEYVDDEGNYLVDEMLTERHLVAQARKLAGRTSQYSNLDAIHGHI